MFRNMKQEVLSPLESELSKRLRPMLGLCFFALRSARKKAFPCRGYLQKLGAEAATMEEIVDGYGAQRNECWFAFREGIAAQKLFSEVAYDMLHIQNSVQSYTLLGTCSDLSRSTEKIRRMLKRAIIRVSRNLIKQARQIGIIDGPVPTDFEKCDEQQLDALLPSDRSVRHIQKIGETVVYLATRFLNLSEDRQVLELLKPREKEEYARLVPGVIDEEKCRLVEASFHNLQSLYDTYIFESDIESQNRNLSYLRGHISIIYHFMKNATALTHYYIRHMSKLSRTTTDKMELPLEHAEILGIIFDYLFYYANQYLESAVHLCRDMIKSYSEEKTITVTIPNYRGFHVRPSTLIAKIVAHYGSSVTMFLDGDDYNAASPMSLFRANEAINAVKRRRIADLIASRRGLQRPVTREDSRRATEIQVVFLDMINSEELMVYEPNLPFSEVEPVEGETMADYASRCIKHFQSLAKLDAKTDTTVTFQGDNRALNDLQILAENGYGEDKLGNNIPLPEELSYLRQ
jgi:hypothetical protein